MKTYQPGEIGIYIGLPGTGFSVEITDWVSMTATRASQRFTFSKGVLGEPFLEMSTDSSRQFALTILQSSPNVEELRNLYIAQLAGFVGFPFTIIDNATDNTTTQKHQKSFYPVSAILDEPQESFGLDGGTWTYQIGSPSGSTFFF